MATRQHGAQLVLAAAQQFFQIGRARAATGRLRPRAPWALAATARTPRAPALIAPRHSRYLLAGRTNGGHLIHLLRLLGTHFPVSTRQASLRRSGAPPCIYR